MESRERVRYRTRDEVVGYREKDQTVEITNLRRDGARYTAKIDDQLGQGNEIGEGRREGLTVTRGVNEASSKSERGDT